MTGLPESLDLPCELCGEEARCTCPPCDCVWCRHRRDESTPAERRMVEARDRAFALSDARKLAREEAARMGDALRRYNSTKEQSDG